MGKAGPIVEKIKFTVEKDPHKLVNYCCGSNIYTDGEDIKVFQLDFLDIFVSIQMKRLILYCIIRCHSIELILVKA